MSATQNNGQHTGAAAPQKVQSQAQQSTQVQLQAYPAQQHVQQQAVALPQQQHLQYPHLAGQGANQYGMHQQMRPYMPYPAMPMNMKSQSTPLEQALETAKCCLGCCNMKCGMPWLYGCAIGWGITIALIVILSFVAFSGLMFLFDAGIISMIAFIVAAIGMLLCGIFGCIGNSNKSPGMVIAAIIGNILLGMGQLTFVVVSILGVFAVNDGIDKAYGNAVSNAYGIRRHLLYDRRVHYEAPMRRENAANVAKGAVGFWMYLWIGWCSLLFIAYAAWIYDQCKFYKVLKKFKKSPMMPHALQMQNNVQV